MSEDFAEVTEIAGEPISHEQLRRLRHRYAWAASRARGRDVVECACGTGPGLGLLRDVAASLCAGDLCARMVAAARAHYGERVAISRFDAQELPFADRSKDVILLFEAIYYLPDASRFVEECARVLRPGGEALIATANKDLWDFHPSAYSRRYFGVVELNELFEKHGFRCEIFGVQDVRSACARERALRPLKRLAVALGLIPRTMAGKRWLKRIVFGGEVAMPAEIGLAGPTLGRATPLDPTRPDRDHKILYCAARWEGAAARPGGS